MTIEINTSRRVSSIFWGRALLPNGIHAPWGDKCLMIGMAIGHEGDPHPIYPVEEFIPEDADVLPDGRVFMHETKFGVSREDIERFRQETGVDIDVAEDALVAACYKLHDWLKAKGQ